MAKEPSKPTPPPTRPGDLPVWLYLGVPILTVLLLWIVPLGGRDVYDLLIPDEIGLLEIGTVVFLLPAVVICVLIFLRRRDLPRRFGVAILLLGLATLYFAGEEISWGQTYFHWKTPESFVSLNRQKETNLHNLEFDRYGQFVDLFDDLLSNVPRQILLALTIVGGVILPLALRRRPQKPGTRRSLRYWAIPTVRIVPAAALAVLSTVPEKLYTALVKHNPAATKWPRDSYPYMAFIDPGGELKEYAFGLVILLYVLSIYRRLRAAPPAEVPAP